MGDLSVSNAALSWRKRFIRTLVVSMNSKAGNIKICVAIKKQMQTTGIAEMW